MHICPDEVMAVVAMVPLLPWLLSKVVWWRARVKRCDVLVEGDGISPVKLVEVRECRGCGEEMNR
jgi:hypothetical protein